MGLKYKKKLYICSGKSYFEAFLECLYLINIEIV